MLHSPIWDDPHNEKIDERILRLIRECPVVVLDVAHDNFNVGLEAGYALGLNKPIVAIRKKPPKGSSARVQQLPFDISTLYTHTYTTDAVGKAELIEKLSERILVGLEEAKLKALRL